MCAHHCPRADACRCHTPPASPSRHQGSLDVRTTKSFLDNARKQRVGIVLSRCCHDLGIVRGPDAYAMTASVLRQYLLDRDPRLSPTTARNLRSMLLPRGSVLADPDADLMDVQLADITKYSGDIPLASEDAALKCLSEVWQLPLRLDAWLLMVEDFPSVTGALLPAVHTVSQVLKSCAFK